MVVVTHTATVSRIYTHINSAFHSFSHAVKTVLMTDKQARAKNIGSRIVGHIRLHLRNVRGVDSNVRDNQGFVFRDESKRLMKVDLTFGTISEASKIVSARFGRKGSYINSSNVQLKASWDDAHFDLPVRLRDFKDHTACLRMILSGGHKPGEFREIARINVKFLKTRSIGEQCKKMHLSENVTISKNREKDMWIEASKSFSVKPYS